MGELVEISQQIWVAVLAKRLRRRSYMRIGRYNDVRLLLNRGYNFLFLQHCPCILSRISSDRMTRARRPGNAPGTAVPARTPGCTERERTHADYFRTLAPDVGKDNRFSAGETNGERRHRSGACLRPAVVTRSGPQDSLLSAPWIKANFIG